MLHAELVVGMSGRFHVARIVGSSVDFLQNSLPYLYFVKQKLLPNSNRSLGSMFILRNILVAMLNLRVKNPFVL